MKEKEEIYLKEKWNNKDIYHENKPYNVLTSISLFNTHKPHILLLKGTEYFTKVHHLLIVFYYQDEKFKKYMMNEIEEKNLSVGLL
jgi:hypothetical protein